MGFLPYIFRRNLLNLSTGALLATGAFFVVHSPRNACAQEALPATDSPTAEATVPQTASEAPQSSNSPEVAVPDSTSSGSTTPDSATPDASPGTEPEPVSDGNSPTASSAENEVPVISVPTVGQGGLPLPAGQPSRLFADHVRYEGGVIIAEGEGDKSVRFESPTGRIEAKRIYLDVNAKSIRAEGTVFVERQREVSRREIAPRTVPRRQSQENVTETLRGDNLNYNFTTQKGSLDNAHLELANFNLSTTSLIINGRRYTAHDIVLRPGALTAAEQKIYGTPPLNLRAKTVTVEAQEPGEKVRAAASGGGLYFRNTKILPVPSYVFRSLANVGGTREEKAFNLTPRLSFSSADGVLVTTELRYPLSKDNPTGTALLADIGLSARVGLRGGLSLEAPTRFGTFRLSGRRSDIVTTQLTNRIELDRKPELTFYTPTVALFGLPGGRRVSFQANASTGRYTERSIGGGGDVDATRNLLEVVLSTRSEEVDGPYVELFGRTAGYSNLGNRYRSTGFEVGYYGDVFNRVRGLFSYRSTGISGATPFRFDRIEIAKELRSTFDIQLTPRYIIPIDLRYDLDLKKFRDERFGILRNYKTFAYGVTYQRAHQELKLEFRQGF